MVIAGQIEKLLGLDVAANEFLPTVKEIASELGSANGPMVVLSVGLLAVALAVRRVQVSRFPDRPVRRHRLRSTVAAPPVTAPGTQRLPHSNG